MGDRKHIGKFEDCPYCRRYIRLGGTVWPPDVKGYTATCRHHHRIAIKRQEQSDQNKKLDN